MMHRKCILVLIASVLVVGLATFCFLSCSGDDDDDNDNGTDLNWQEIVTENVPGARFSHTTVAINNAMYVFGGTDNLGVSFFDDLWKLPSDLSDYEELQPSGEKPAGRYYHAAAVVDGKMFIYGGLSYQNGPFMSSDMWVYDPVLNSWEMIGYAENNTPPSRLMHSLVSVDNILYLYGGQGDTAEALDDFWAFDTTTKTWNQLTPNPLAPRYGHGAEVINGQMYVIAGADDETYHNDTWMCQISSGQWTKLDCQLEPGYSPPPRAFHGTLAQLAALWIFGGRGLPTSVTLHDVYKMDISATGSCQISEQPALPEASLSLDGVDFDNRAVIFGGRNSNGNASNRSYSLEYNE